jgi:hypothetical protein
MNRTGIAVGGWWRLRKAIEAEVRREYQKTLSSVGFWRRIAIEKEIRKEVQKRLRRKASPYSLWSSLQFPNWGGSSRE